MTDMMRNKDETAMVIISALLLATWLIVVIGVVYVGWHFTMKYW